MANDFFPEDDEMDADEAKNELRRIDGDMAMMADRRHEVARQLKKRALDPVTAKIAELAHTAGYNMGISQKFEERIKFLERRIEVRDRALDELSDRNDWKARALAAEATLERSRKLRRKR